MIFCEKVYYEHDDRELQRVSGQSCYFMPHENIKNQMIFWNF